MTIEEGVRSFLTSGVARGGSDEATELTMGNLRTVADFERVQEGISGEESREG